MSNPSSPNQSKLPEVSAPPLPPEFDISQSQPSNELVGYSPPVAIYPQPQPKQRVITEQPMPSASDRDSWMAAPAQALGPAPGLDYLANVGYIFVEQEVELVEAFFGWESNNRYQIKNHFGQNLFYAEERTGFFNRWCCNTRRSFTIKIFDYYQNEIMRLSRRLAFNTCFCPCYLQRLEVQVPPGNVIGTVNQTWSCLTPSFDIRNELGYTMFLLRGPICKYSICGDIEFKFYTPEDKQEVGKISKKWSGFMKEMFTDADHFGISFPVELDIRTKAIMIGACFLIDFMYFEEAPSK
ncbi:phospholipid scramblase 1-like [Planococcus citri]|uniref:phospholipid scramblase 1-like n=1 Tax=Planococcus citri TaxID=170843 RepID=UPI0031F8838A